MRFLIFLLSLLFAGLANAPTSANDGKLVQFLRFTNYEQGAIDDWLQGKGFQFQLDAQKQSDNVNSVIHCDYGSSGGMGRGIPTRF
jgi:hypothetical protein